MVVGENLKFDVPRVLQEFLQIDLVVAECGQGFSLGYGDRAEQGGFAMDDAHPAATASSGRLDDDRVADVTGETCIFLIVFCQGPVRAGNTRNAGLSHGAYCGNLVAHESHGLRLRADEDKATLLNLLREIGVLRQESIAGMNGD